MAFDVSFKQQLPVAQIAQLLAGKKAEEEKIRLLQDQNRRENLSSLLNSLTQGATLGRTLQQANQERQQQANIGNLSSIMNEPSSTAAVTKPIQQYGRTQLTAPGLSDVNELPDLQQTKTVQPTFGQVAAYNPVTQKATPLAETQPQRLNAAMFKAYPAVAAKQFLERQYSEKTPKDISFENYIKEGETFPRMGRVNNSGIVVGENNMPLGPGYVKSTGVNPFSTNSPSASMVTEEDRKRLTPLAKRVVEGTAKPSDFVSSRGNEKEKISLIASEIDPNFDLSLVPQRIKTRRDYSAGGPTGQSLNSINTVIAHMDTLKNKIDALDNSKLVKYNDISNYLSKETGSPQVGGYNAAEAAVFSELGRTFQGVGVVTNEQRSAFKHSLSASSSKEQAKEVIGTFIDLIKGRADSLKYGWEQSMGNAAPPVPFINEKSRKTLTRWGYDANSLEKTGISSPSNGRPPLNSFYK